MPTQDQVRKMVNENVLVSVTSLIYNLFADDNYADRLYGITRSDDYESTGLMEGYKVEDRPDGFYYADAEQVNSYEGPYHTEYEAWKAACENNNIDPIVDEIQEHYVVTEWLGRKLSDLGQLVDYDFMGLTIWGRRATGQAVYLDYVMELITAETPQYMKE